MVHELWIDRADRLSSIKQAATSHYHGVVLTQEGKLNKYYYGA